LNYDFTSADAVKTVRGRAMPVLDFSAKANGILLNLLNYQPHLTYEISQIPPVCFDPDAFLPRNIRTVRLRNPGISAYGSISG
jgi:hypothetical protein